MSWSVCSSHLCLGLPERLQRRGLTTSPPGRKTLERRTSSAGSCTIVANHRRLRSLYIVESGLTVMSPCRLP
eukprot:3086748-Prorocentrum_lima.AAC.1